MSQANESEETLFKNQKVIRIIIIWLTVRGKNSKKRDKLYFDIHKQEQARNREKIHKKQFSQKISREVQNVNHKTPEVATPKTLGYQQFSEKSSIEFKRFNPNPGMTNDSIGNLHRLGIISLLLTPNRVIKLTRQFRSRDQRVKPSEGLQRERQLLHQVLRR